MNLKIIFVSNYVKIGLVEAELFHVDGQTSELTTTFAMLQTHQKVYPLF
jgi:hypothetical protein